MSVPITPIPSNLFTKYFLDSYDERMMIEVPTGFLSFFGNPANGGRTTFSPDSNQIEIDILRGNEKIAALIPRGLVSRTITGKPETRTEENFTNFARSFPLVEEQGAIHGNELLNRTIGEHPYSAQMGGMTQFDRLRKKGMDIYREKIKQIIRLDEVLAAQSMLTGKMDAILGTTNPDLQYDFRRSAGNTISVPTVWTSASATPIADLDAACLRVQREGHAKPDMVVMNKEAIAAFLNNPQILSAADNRRYIDEVVIQNKSMVPAHMQRFVDAGMVVRGRIVTNQGFELYLFSYNEHYENDAGTDIDFIPTGYVMVTSSKARFDRHFGPPERLPLTSQDIAMYTEYFGISPTAVNIPAEVLNSSIIPRESFYLDAYIGENRKGITMRCQHAPIFATTQTDAVAVLTDTAT